MNISETSRSLLASGRKVITTIRSYGEQLQKKAAHANSLVNVTIIDPQETNHAEA
jgi:hypothetical protein